MRISVSKIRLAAVALCATFWLAPTAYAASNAAVSQGFQADNGRGTIVAGALVSFKPGSHSVELAATDTSSQLAGAASQNSLVALGGNTQDVQVVLSGTTTVLVSDINGDIHAGDKITASPIAGVGMISPTDSRIVGVAKADLDTGTSQTQTVTDVHGSPHTVHIGYIPLQVGLAYYQNPSTNFLPPFIQNLANSIAGKQVSLVRVLISLVLLLAGIISLSVLIYSSVRSAMISLGRNPLAASHIRRGLLQVGIVTVAVWGGALVACYLILVL